MRNHALIMKPRLVITGPLYWPIYKMFTHIPLEIFAVEQQIFYLLKREYCTIWKNDLYQIERAMFLPRRFAKQTSLVY